MTIEECLNDAGRMLQEEVDKQMRQQGSIGSVGASSHEAESTAAQQESSEEMAAVTTSTEPINSMTVASSNNNNVEDDDAMIAAFFAKQKAAAAGQSSTAASAGKQELPVKEWARVIVTNHQRRLQAQQESLAKPSTSLTDLNDKEQQLVDDLLKTFQIAQNS